MNTKRIYAKIQEEGNKQKKQIAKEERTPGNSHCKTDFGDIHLHKFFESHGINCFYNEK